MCGLVWVCAVRARVLCGRVCDGVLGREGGDGKRGREGGREQGGKEEGRERGREGGTRAWREQASERARSPSKRSPSITTARAQQPSAPRHHAAACLHLHGDTRSHLAAHEKPSPPPTAPSTAPEHAPARPPAARSHRPDAGVNEATGTDEHGVYASWRAFFLLTTYRQSSPPPGSVDGSGDTAYSAVSVGPPCACLTSHHPQRQTHHYTRSSSFQRIRYRLPLRTGL